MVKISYLDMLKQGLQQSLRQQLSPLQIQMVRMLESTSLEMEERILQELDENPVLEEVNPESQHEELPDENRGEEGDGQYDDDADFSMSDYKTDDTPDYKFNANNGTDDDRHESVITESSSLHEMLLDQLRLKRIEEDKEQLAEYVIGNIDQDGYLRREPENMADDYLFQTGKQVPDDEVRKAIELVQTLEPAGVGAANLQECLLLQLKRKKKALAIDKAINILMENFEDFSKRHYDKLMKKFDIDESTLHEVINEVVKLNPKPGGSIESSSDSSSVQIIPDFIVETEDGQVILSLNDKNLPELRISDDYASQLQELSTNKKNQTEDSRNAALFIKQKIDSAKWFINSIKQRHDTLRRTMQAIIDKQREFFLTGDETKLRPMVLKDIAEVTGYDISTISRVSNSKYVQTDWGVLPLKSFFSESMTMESGEEVSNIEIKTILGECVKNEDKHNPLTDDQLSDILKQKGYVIARRTVAKYRKQLNIAVANLRREI